MRHLKMIKSAMSGAAAAALSQIKRDLQDEISDDASPGLRQIRRGMKTINDRIHTQLTSLISGSARAYLQDSVVTMRDGRYCIPVKSEYKNQVPGMIHDQSSTGFQ